MAENPQDQQLNVLLNMLQQTMLQRQINPTASAASAGYSQFHNAAAMQYQVQMAGQSASTQRMLDMLSARGLDLRQHMGSSMAGRIAGGIMNTDLVSGLTGQGSDYAVGAGLTNLFTRGGMAFGGRAGYGAGIGAMQGAAAIHKDMFGTGGYFVNGAGLLDKGKTGGLDKTRLGAMLAADNGSIGEGLSVDVISLGKGKFTTNGLSPEQVKTMGDRISSKAKMIAALNDVFPDKSVEELSQLAQKMSGSGRMGMGDVSGVRASVARLRGQAAAMGIDERAYIGGVVALQDRLEGSVGRTTAFHMSEGIVRTAALLSQEQATMGAGYYETSKGEHASRLAAMAEAQHEQGSIGHMLAVAAASKATGNTSLADSLLKAVKGSNGDDSEARRLLSLDGNALNDYFRNTDSAESYNRMGRPSDVREFARLADEQNQLNGDRSVGTAVKDFFVGQGLSADKMANVEKVLKLANSLGMGNTKNLLTSGNVYGMADELKKSGVNVSDAQLSELVALQLEQGKGGLDVEGIARVVAGKGGITGAEARRAASVRGAVAALRVNAYSDDPATSFVESLLHGALSPDGQITDADVKGALGNSLIRNIDGDKPTALSELMGSNDKAIRMDDVDALDKLRGMGGSMQKALKDAGVTDDMIARFKNADVDERRAMLGELGAKLNDLGQAMDGNDKFGIQTQSRGGEEYLLSYGDSTMKAVKDAVPKLAKANAHAAAERMRSKDLYKRQKGSGQDGLETDEEFLKRIDEFDKTSRADFEARAKMVGLTAKSEDTDKQSLDLLGKYVMSGGSDARDANALFSSLDSAQQKAFKDQYKLLYTEQESKLGTMKSTKGTDMDLVAEQEKKVAGMAERLRELDGGQRFVGVLELASGGGLTINVSRGGTAGAGGKSL